MPKTTVCLSMASTYRFWLSVLGRIVLPREDKMLWVSTSAGLASSAAFIIEQIRSTPSGVRPWPVRSTVTISFTTSAARATAAWVPVRVISLPRTWMSASSSRSRMRRNSSRVPSTFTMSMEDGTLIRRTTAACSPPTGAGALRTGVGVAGLS